LGISTRKENIYKETQDLANVRYADFNERKEILDNIFIRVFIYQKWERIWKFFAFFRFINVRRLLLQFILVQSKN
jgi:hypothetical protein